MTHSHGQRVRRMTRTSTRPPGYIAPLRFRSLTPLYDIAFHLVMRESAWREPLIAAVAPMPGDRILDFGTGTGSTAVALVARSPEAYVVGVDPDHEALFIGLLKVTARRLANVELVRTDSRYLPLAAGSFDKVVSSLVFHHLQPDEKIRSARELLRVLRHGGSLHVADFDKPEGWRERAMFSAVRWLDGESNVRPHADGSWVAALAEGGFANVRRISSYPVAVGRIALVCAKKP